MLRRKLDELVGVQSTLEALLSECAEGLGPGCPLIEALLRDEGNSSWQGAPAEKTKVAQSESMRARTMES